MEHDIIGLTGAKSLGVLQEVPMPAPKKLYKIGEIIRYYVSPGGEKISRQTLHNYTQLGLISAAERTESGHRLYDETVFDRLRKIDLFKRHHTLEEVKGLLDKQ
jgi:DNA-binding transcriptional MerR regulator